MAAAAAHSRVQNTYALFKRRPAQAAVEMSPSHQAHKPVYYGSPLLGLLNAEPIIEPGQWPPCP